MGEENKSALVPRLRFPEFREAAAWEKTGLGEVINLEYGSSLSEEKRNGGTVPVVGSNGIVGYHDEHLVAGPAIVIGRKGSVGEVNWIDRDCYPIDTTYYVTNKNPRSCLLPFLSVLLERSNLPRLKDPSAVPGLNRDSVHSLISFVPKPREQQKIADCLSSLDELITAEAQKLDALKTHKKGLMQQLFPREGETVPRLRFPEFREFREAGEWEEKTLDAVCEMQAGKFIAASEITETQADGLFPCFGGNGLRGYTKTYNQSGRYSLIGRQGALCGNVNLVDGDFYATEHAVVTTPKAGISTDWLFYNLCLLNLNRFATGQAQPGLSVEVLGKVACVVPSDKDEQQKIADCLSSLDALITAQSEKVDALKTHKKSLMQQLFPVPYEAQR